MSGSLHRFGGEAVRGPVQTYLVEVAGLGQQLHFSSNSTYHILPLDRQVRRGGRCFHSHVHLEPQNLVYLM